MERRCSRLAASLTELRERYSMENSFNTSRPSDGQKIEARFPDGKWRKAIYYEGGIDGIIEDEDGDVTEIEEYGDEMLWRIFNR